MQKLLIAALAVTLSTNTLASSSIREKGVLISNGEHLNNIYQLWGNPNFNVRSEKTCNRVIKLKKPTAPHLGKYGKGVTGFGWFNILAV